MNESPIDSTIVSSFEIEDSYFGDPYVDQDEWRDEPARHRYVHGGFKDTEARFSLYFPPAEQYENRFFQFLMHVPGNETLAQDSNEANPSYGLEFVFDSGAYFVESNLGSQGPFFDGDPSIPTYRTSAAVAKLSRHIATELYGSQRPYGYVWGGSGGAYKTISCMESASGVWDGAVPYVMGTQRSLPNSYSVKIRALRLVSDKLPDIVDATQPGSRRSTFDGLSVEEREALAELIKMGFPPRALFNHEEVEQAMMSALSTFFGSLIELDSEYFDDFWEKPGYLGANPPESLQRDRVQHETTVTELVMPEDLRAMDAPLTVSPEKVGDETLPAGLKLASTPEGAVQGASIRLPESDTVSDEIMYVSITLGDTLLIGNAGAVGDELANLEVGDPVVIDNRTLLALQTYHRHQIPPADSYYTGYDQFRISDGSPVYPQRPERLNVQYASQTGEFDGKMIVVQNLMDAQAFPWNADWYRSIVKDALGDDFEDNFRVWYNDHAMHVSPSSTDDSRPDDSGPDVRTQIINYNGILQQALRDLVAWVEQGDAAPQSTTYEIVDGQVEVPPTAADRKGVQPVVDLTANDDERTEAGVGEDVSFAATIEAPPETGSIVEVEWDFEATGEYPVTEELDDTSRKRVTVERTYSFSEPGTYFPAVRATIQRDGDAETDHARIPNLGRVRVVVG